MNIGNQIKVNRERCNLSQEQLAEAIYVSRQTISNWENNKNYPDINSLILLSKTFDVSLDQLVKGDIEKMREVINQEDIKKFTTISYIYSIELLTILFSALPLYDYLKVLGICIWLVFFAITMATALYIEKMKKEHDIQSYKEILAFTEGKKLDEIHKIQEVAKRPYQKILFAIGSAVITIVIILLQEIIINLFK